MEVWRGGVTHVAEQTVLRLAARLEVEQHLLQSLQAPLVLVAGEAVQVAREVAEGQGDVAAQHDALALGVGGVLDGVARQPQPACRHPASRPASHRLAPRFTRRPRHALHAARTRSSRQK